MTAPAMRSPKRKAPAGHSRSSLFRYYAGYSDGFVEDTLAHLKLERGAILLDPWLGGGTTSDLALSNGCRFRGYDINPAMVIVARARTLPTESQHDVPKLVDKVLKSYPRPIKPPPELLDADPL